jgi:glycosyltransferase involved in cell wall biosynthesis
MEDQDTGISRFSKEVVKRLILEYSENKLVLITNKYYSQFQCKQIITKYKPFNLIHWLIFPFFLRKINGGIYVSMQYSGPWFVPKGWSSLITVHDLMYKLIPNFFGGKIKKIIGKYYFNLIVDRSIKVSNGVFSVSETTANDINRIYGITSVVTGEGACIEDPGYNIVKGGEFLYVGSKRPHKNLDILFDAFRKYRSYGGERKLYICGHTSNVSLEGVVYLGFVDEATLASTYKSAYCLIFPSLYEGFGLPLLESISLSTPVIASDIPVFRELDSKNVLLFDPHSVDELVALMLNEISFYPEDANRMLKKYNWNLTADIICNRINYELNR